MEKWGGIGRNLEEIGVGEIIRIHCIKKSISNKKIKENIIVKVHCLVFGNGLLALIRLAQAIKQKSRIYLKIKNLWIN